MSQLLSVDQSKLSALQELLPVFPSQSSFGKGWGQVNLQVFGATPAWEMPRHIFKQHSIAIHFESVLSVERRLDGKLKLDRICEGDSVLIPANIEHWSAWQKGVSKGFLVLTVEPNLIAQIAHETVEPNRVELIPQFLSSDPLLSGIGLTLKNLLESEEEADFHYLDSLSHTLAIYLLKNYSSRKPILREYGNGLSRYKLKIAIEYIQSHLEQSIKLADIAVLVGMSQYYFCRQFSQSMGMSPYRYVIRQRVERAKHLLGTNRSMTIADVALECGFTHQSHFTKHFKKDTGITPNAYRRAIP